MSRVNSLQHVDALQHMFGELGDYLDSHVKMQECEQLKLRVRYNDAVSALNSAQKGYECFNARNAFESLGDFLDSRHKVQECTEKAEYIRKENVYNEAKNLLDKGYIEDVSKAVTLFESISDFKDSTTMIQKCKKKIEEVTEAERKRKSAERKKNILVVSLFALFMFILITIANKMR